jgi:hypothetical protein
VLYDKYHDEEFAQPDLDVYLPNLYRTESELLVVFLCPEYAAKRWCRLEWRYIRQLIATLDAERVMLLSFGDPGDLSQIGILPGDGYIDVTNQPATVIAEKICKRLRLNQGITPPKPTTTIPADISRVVKYAPAELIGRDEEMKLLSDAWANVQSQAQGRSRIVIFVALGGEGKTSLVAKWAAELAADNWPGCDGAFAWSFYSQGTREQVAASSDLFLKTALDFFGDDEDRKFAGGSAWAVEKAQRLARIVAARHCLLILDGLEPLQYPPSSTAHPPGTLRDAGVAELLRRLAQQGQGLCVITTRYALPDLQAFHGATVREQRLPRLSREAGVRLLKKLGVRGSELRNLPFRSPDNGKTEQVNEFELLVEDVKGHALTLHLLGSYLRDAYNGDIRRRDQVRLAEADADEQSGHTFRVMDAYAHWLAQGGATAAEQARGQQALALLQLLGLFDRPATADCLHALWQAPVIAGLTDALFTVQENGPGRSQTAQPISAPQRNLSLKRLEDAGLLTIIRAADSHELSALDTHPHIREYFAQRLRGQLGEGWHEAQRRVYEHLCATTEDKAEPTLDDLLPLYQAVAHGCQAGLQQEACEKVYLDRILRGTGSDGNYSTFKLGAIGSDLSAIACFFETPWSRVAPALSEAAQAWLLNEAAFSLRALGRLTEALEPMRATVEMYVKQESWEYAAITASNLSELELTLGEVVGAVRDAEQSVRYADRSGDADRQMVSRTIHADALHQAGRRAEAETRFHEAEQMQAANQPSSPLLYSVRGFRYCDLLLAQAERAAWANAERGTQNAELIAACRAVTDRADTALKIVLNGSRNLLDIALNHLTLGCAALFEALLTQSAFHNPQSAIESAVSGLRRAGRQDYLPRSLLTRAWLRALTGAHTGPDSAQSDLDEAWEIAARGAMKLHQADIHLYRARLFGLRKADSGLPIAEPYPWQSPEHDLAEAERLINACGYHRRDEELEDAKRAILGQDAK